MKMVKIKFVNYNTLTGVKEFENETVITQKQLDLYLTGYNYLPYDTEGKSYHVNENQYKKIVTILN